jgi:hypothetical protein
MKNITSLLTALALTLSVTGAGADPLPDRSSTFDTDAEGWLPSAGGNLAWQAGGYLQGSSANVAWHFTSPPAWAGSWQHYQLIKFDLAIVNRQYADAPRNNILVIRGANGTDLFWSGFSPEFNWTHYEVPLVPAAFGVDQATFDGVMQSVTELRILGEYTTAAEQTGLDNVVASLSDAPIVPPDLLTDFETGSEGWRPAGGVSMTWQSSGGNPGDTGRAGGSLRRNRQQQRSGSHRQCPPGQGHRLL